jgi:hypothetical protein
MSWFWRKRRMGLRRPTSLRLRLDELVEKRQRQLAAFLERKTAYWSRPSKLIALAVFCLLFGGLSLWLLWQGFRNF